MAFENENEQGFAYRIANSLTALLNKPDTNAVGVPVVTSGTITTSGQTATVAFTATERVEVLNPAGATMFASWSTPNANGTNSFPINVGGSYAPGHGVVGTLTLLSTQDAQRYTVNRFTANG